MPQNLVLPEPILEKDPTFLIGRFVRSYRDALDDYFPSRQTSLQSLSDKYLLPASEESDTTRVISSIVSESVKAKLQNIVQAAASRKAENSVALETALVKTYKLEQLQSSLNELLKKDGFQKELRDFVEGSPKKTVYWIVGLKTVYNAKISMERNSKQTSAGGFRLPLTSPIGIQATGNGDIQAAASSEKTSEITGKSTLNGEYIFAVRYCPISLKRGIGSSDFETKSQTAGSGARTGKSILSALGALRKAQIKLQNPKNFSQKEGLSFSKDDGRVDPNDWFELDSEEVVPEDEDLEFNMEVFD